MEFCFKTDHKNNKILYHADSGLSSSEKNSDRADPLR